MFLGEYGHASNELWVRYLGPLMFPTPWQPGVGQTVADEFCRDSDTLTSWGAAKKLWYLKSFLLEEFYITNKSDNVVNSDSK